MRSRAAALFALALYLSAACQPAQAAAPKAAASPSSSPIAEDVRFDTPSGYPVPRFVSLKDDETNCRIGPSFEHPVRFVFKRAGAPVLVVAESVDHWRKVRDSVGDECWVHKTTLKSLSHVLIINDVGLHARPSKAASVSGRIGAGVLARLVNRRDDWLFVTAGGARGWVNASAVWGGAATTKQPDRWN